MGPRTKRQRQATDAVNTRYDTSFDVDDFIPKFSKSFSIDDFQEQTQTENIFDIINKILEFFKEQLDWNNVLHRNMSVFVYALLKSCGILMKDIHNILSNIGLSTTETATYWYNEYATGDYSGLYEDGRKYHKSDCFYDIYPDIETNAKTFALSKSSVNTCDFTLYDLAQFITDRYQEETGFSLENQYIRSLSSCRRDLLKWGFYYGNNSQRPFCDGHERDDVVLHRKRFVEYFIHEKSSYYTLTSDSECEWVHPVCSKNQRPRVLISHDESTFRSGDVCKFKWMFPGKEPCYSKGRKRSLMISDFIVQHPSGPFFELSDSEWKLASKKYPQLLEIDDVSYYKNSSSAYIALNGINYFDNDTILKQFERVFQMLEFKQAFKNHEIEILVDNATTHTTKTINLNQFRKGSGFNCPVDFIEWVDSNNNFLRLDCYFNENGVSKSKGLFQIAKELKLIDEKSLPKSYKLEELREFLKAHPAFKEEIKLEELAKQYGVKIIYIPKFHSEFSPIEGIWAYQKQYVRKRNDQKFEKFKDLILNSRDILKNHELNAKLWRRFWNSLDAYNNGETYKQVLIEFFGAKCQTNIQSHRKITNTNLKLNN